MEKNWLAIFHLSLNRERKSKRTSALELAMVAPKGMEYFEIDVGAAMEHFQHGCWGGGRCRAHIGGHQSFFYLELILMMLMKHLAMCK